MTDIALKPGEDGKHILYCRTCEALCGLEATVENGRLVKVEADRENVSSRGYICTKAPNMVDVVNDPERVCFPLKRTGGPGEFTRVSWDEALEDIARRLARCREDYGGESIGAYVGNPMAFAGVNYDMVTAAVAG